MFAVLVGYGALLLLIGLYHARRIGDFREYVIAGGRQGAGVITLSLLASIVGGSATMGVVGMAATMGFPAFWWLGVGSLGLLVQAWLLSARVRALNACTLPDVAGITVGSEARAITALIIAVSWTGIVAAQFTALSQIFAVMTGLADSRPLLVGLSLVVILYTAGGGQLSVLRTDALQVILVFGGVAAACIVLWAGEGPSDGWLARVELLNENFGWKELVSLALLAGLSFVIGPDILSRNLSARDGATARRATLLAAGGLSVFAVCITLVGVWAGQHGLAGNGENPLVTILRDHLPAPVAALLALGLISALVSSADTCLMSAATILEHDFFRRDNLARTRVFVVLVGLLSLGVALMKSDIISLLMAAYSVYVPGVVLPLFVALMWYGRRPLSRPLWLAGVVLGGVCGFMAGALAMPALSFAGMALSCLLAVAAGLAPVRRAFSLLV